MISIKDKEVKLVDFKPGTLIYDSEANRPATETVVLVVEGYDNVEEGRFVGIYLKNMRYSDGLSLSYRGWKLFEGTAEIKNE